MFGTLLNVGYFALLRPGELLKLKAFDIMLPNSVSLGAPFAVVRLDHPKNLRQMGKQQFAEVHHPDAVNWLGWLVRTTGPSATLRPSRPNKFRMMFKQICFKLGLDGLKLSSLAPRCRRNHDALLDEKIEVSRIPFQGRWANLRSLEHYLQVAPSQQMRIKNLIIDCSFMLSLPAYLAAQIPDEHLLPTRVVAIKSESDVVAAVRAWGRMGQGL